MALNDSPERVNIRIPAVEVYTRLLYGNLSFSKRAVN